MWLDLCCVWVPSNSESFHEVLRNVDPVFIREGHFMSIQVASRSIKLPKNLNLFKSFNLPPESISKVCELLADSAWGCTLAMGPAHHWNISILCCEAFQSALQVLQLREHDILHGVVKHEGVAEVVDVFRSTREMEVLFKTIHLV